MSTEAIAGPGKHELFFSGALKVRKDVVLMDARVNRLSPGSKVLALKVNRYWAGDGWPAGTRLASYPHFGGCFYDWPPEGFGPLVDVRGFEARKGDIIQFSSYAAHPEAPGDYFQAGIRVRYRIAGSSRVYATVFDDGNRSDFKRVSDTPPDQHCATLDGSTGESKAIWFMRETDFWRDFGGIPGETKKVLPSSAPVR